ncbi:MAG: hypothetical protein KKF26_01745 [Chloroflexi bacterium]|nr:hypothetical protein [Chloroflexota bacterium]
MIRTIRDRFSRLKVLRGEMGFGLVDAVIAVAVAGTAVVAFVAALSTGSLAVNELDEQTVAQRLAVSQLEEIKISSYDTSYSLVDTPSGYSISVGVSSTPDADVNIQKITVTISRDGEGIFTVANYKVNR